jgi:hypothetical protein
MWRNRTYETNMPHRHSVEHVAPPTSDNTSAKVAATGKHIQGKVPGENRETNSQEAEDCQTKLKPGTKSGETTRNDPTTLEETQETLNVQKKGGAAKQREEDIPLDWAEEVTTHEEDQAEEMEVSTENLSENEKTGRPDRTQETGTHKKQPPLTKAATTRTDRKSLKHHADEYQKSMNSERQKRPKIECSVAKR